MRRYARVIDTDAREQHIIFQDTEDEDESTWYMFEESVRQGLMIVTALNENPDG